MTKGLSRRQFLIQGAFYGGSLCLLCNVPRPLAADAARKSTQPEVLNESEWRTVEAITGRIIPTDHEPGAIEANCVNFIDKALLHEDAELKPVYQAGLGGIDGLRAEVVLQGLSRGELRRGQHPGEGHHGVMIRA